MRACVHPHADIMMLVRCVRVMGVVQRPAACGRHSVNCANEQVRPYWLACAGVLSRAVSGRARGAHACCRRPTRLLCACGATQYGRIGTQGELKDPAITQHFDRSWDNSVYRVTQAVLAAAERDGVSTADAANKLADAAARQPHPIWGASRSRDIMASLIADEWTAGGNL